MRDPRVVMLANMRAGSGLHAASGSMADDLGRLAAGVIELDMFVRRLWTAVRAASKAESASCSYPGTRCGFGQHSIECAVTKTREAFLSTLDECPTEAIRELIGDDEEPPETIETIDISVTNSDAQRRKMPRCATPHSCERCQDQRRVVLADMMPNGDVVGYVADCCLPLSWSTSGKNCGGYDSAYDACPHYMRKFLREHNEAVELFGILDQETAK